MTSQPQQQQFQNPEGRETEGSLRYRVAAFQRGLREEPFFEAVIDSKGGGVYRTKTMMHITTPGMEFDAKDGILARIEGTARSENISDYTINVEVSRSVTL